MTENEAIDKLNNLHYKIVHTSFCNKVYESEIEALCIAKDCLKEIQQYRAIGTVEEFKALKEKAEPKKVKTNKYMVGDRVVYIGNSLDFKGKMGTIIRLAEKHGQEYDEVKFDDPYFIDNDGCKYYDYFCFAKNLQKIDKQ